MSNYTAKNITVLEGLDPVRKRPGMYIGGVGTAGLHHLVWELLDNAVDEAMNGFASSIVLTLHADGSSITISDDGRGIPVDKHSSTKKSALEVIFTMLHAGGKFEHGSYKTAGGLHGVGASVVNALSAELRARVKRDGALWEMAFRRGKPTGPLKKAGAARGSGTTVFFHPDPTIFPKVEFDPATIRGRLEVASYIHKGIRVTFENEADRTREIFHHEEGLSDYLKKIVEERGARPVHDVAFVQARESEPRLDLVLQWTEATDEHVRSYVNGIPTGSGGTHENGLRAGLGKAVRNYIDTHSLSPKGVTLVAEDIREGLTGVVSIFIQEPQFQGQTKDRLNNPELTSAVDSAVRPALEHWLNHNRSVAEAIVGRVILAARAREASRAAQAEVTRKTATSGRLNLPGKLSDCTGAGREDSELFVVEGDSAGGLREAGTGSREASHSSASRQGDEHRRSDAGQGAREQGACRSRHGAWMRPGQELRPREASVREGRHSCGCGFRRPPHRDAAADLPLPPHTAAHLAREGLPRPAAALSDRRRQGDLLGLGRCPSRPAPEAARQRARPPRDHAVQGAWRDDAQGALGDDTQPEDAAAVES